MRNTLKKIDEFLEAHGYAIAEARILIRNQFLLTVFGGAVYAVLSGFSRAPLDFLAGALLAAYNFCSMARVVQGIVLRSRKQAVISLLFGFYARMFLTCGALYALIVWYYASVPALATGLTTVVINIMLWIVTRFWEQKVKEA